MDTLQIRVNQGMVKMMDSLVDKGLYSSRSDVIRDAVRRFVWSSEVATIVNKGKGVDTVRKLREKLSKKKFNLKDINGL